MLNRLFKCILASAVMAASLGAYSNVLGHVNSCDKGSSFFKYLDGNRTLNGISGMVSAENQCDEKDERSGNRKQRTDGDFSITVPNLRHTASGRFNIRQRQEKNERDFQDLDLFFKTEPPPLLKRQCLSSRLKFLTPVEKIKKIMPENFNIGPRGSGIIYCIKRAALTECGFFMAIL